ncbi:MAG: cell division protein ZapA [Gammaproteobacteria bacterium]
MPVKLTVRRHSFTIACEKGSEDAMRRAAKKVEETISEVRDKWQVADGERAAIMAALTLVHGGSPQITEQLCARIDAALLRTVPRGRASDGVNQ